jgi:pimeloyl-ACP methyl ester carboxylesterase
MRRLCIPLVVLALAAAGPAPTPAQTGSGATTYVLVHGAWGGAWDWQVVDSLLVARGHPVHRPTLTGLGKRSHLVSLDIGLETHIRDVVNEIVWEGLTDVVLVGHSYGGMVITGVAGRVPGRVRELVYIDAFLPRPGESALELLPSQAQAAFQANLRDGLLVPVWEPADKPIPRDVPHPLKTLTDPLVLDDGVPRVPGRYILTREPAAETDTFDRFAERAAARGWPVTVMEAGHVPNRTQPAELTRLLVTPPPR